MTFRITLFLSGPSGVSIPRATLNGKPVTERGSVPEARFVDDREANAPDLNLNPLPSA